MLQASCFQSWAHCPMLSSSLCQGWAARRRKQLNRYRSPPSASCLLILSSKLTTIFTTCTCLTNERHAAFTTLTSALVMPPCRRTGKRQTLGLSKGTFEVWHKAITPCADSTQLECWAHAHSCYGLQVNVGIGTLAGSTIMLLTVAWGGSLIAGRCDLDDRVRASVCMRCS